MKLESFQWQDPTLYSGGSRKYGKRKPAESMRSGRPCEIPKMRAFTKEKMLKQSRLCSELRRKWQPCTSSEANQRGVNPEYLDFDALKSLQSIHYTLLDFRNDRTRP